MTDLAEILSKCNRTITFPAVHKYNYLQNIHYTFLYPEHFLVPQQDLFKISTDGNTYTSLSNVNIALNMNILFLYMSSSATEMLFKIVQIAINAFQWCLSEYFKYTKNMKC